MASQDIQLEVMAEGGFDTNFEETEAEHWNTIDDLTPESIMIMRESVEDRLSNPCTGCEHNDSTDPHVLDFCHYTCKDDHVDAILLEDEVDCEDCPAAASEEEVEEIVKRLGKIFGTQTER